MFGLVYLLWSLVSHTGAVIKEGIHNVNAKVDPRTNTFINYQGQHVDYDTGELRFLFHENGDEVLRDKHLQLVRNLSKEEREKAYAKARENNDGSFAFKTDERRWISFNNGLCNVKSKAQIYKDMVTGEEYATTYITTDAFKKEKKEFYVKVSDPTSLVRLSDNERKLEKLLKDNGVYNWISHPEDEQSFIDSYNKASNKKELVFKLN